jgi:hypothetical protein
LAGFGNDHNYDVNTDYGDGDDEDYDDVSSNISLFKKNNYQGKELET